MTALAIMCYNRSNQCAGLQKLVGLHFQECGLKDMELNMLDRMGVSASPSTLDKVREDLKAMSAQRISDIAKSGKAVLAYNNEQMEDVKDRTQAKRRKIQSVTNSIVFEATNLPPGGLGPQIGNVREVDPDEVISPPSATINSPISNKIRKVLIHWALEETFPMTYEKKFGKRPSLPEISRLENRTTNYAPLTSLIGNKSTIDGALSVVREIYPKQLKDMPTVKYREKMLVMGDPETTQGLRVGKVYQNDSSDHNPFCDLKWSVPMPGLFHLKMDALKFICDQHYNGRKDASKLQHNVEYMTDYMVDTEKNEEVL